jgi:hypothetical protein
MASIVDQMPVGRRGGSGCVLFGVSSPDLSRCAGQTVVMTTTSSPVLIILTDRDRAELESLARARKAPLRMVQHQHRVVAGMTGTQQHQNGAAPLVAQSVDLGGQPTS